MTELAFWLLAEFESGQPVQDLAASVSAPVEWVWQQILAARLCLGAEMTSPDRFPDADAQSYM